LALPRRVWNGIFDAGDLLERVLLEGRGDKPGTLAEKVPPPRKAIRKLPRSP